VTPEVVATGLGRPSIVVLDPSREGAGIDVMRALAGLAPTLRRVVYVSCDAASFSRDARVMLDERWTLTSLRVFDIFPMTEHVEIVGSFEPPV
jgi:tRNA/tmRNA/rRNA uracil-C5-methylase (TrmA/RlmC/RlmD family)